MKTDGKWQLQLESEEAMEILDNFLANFHQPYVESWLRSLKPMPEQLTVESLRQARQAFIAFLVKVEFAATLAENLHKIFFPNASRKFYEGLIDLAENDLRHVVENDMAGGLDETVSELTQRGWKTMEDVLYFRPELITVFE